MGKVIRWINPTENAAKNAMKTGEFLVVGAASGAERVFIVDIICRRSNRKSGVQVLCPTTKHSSIDEWLDKMVNYVYKSIDDRCSDGWNCSVPPGDVTCEGAVNPVDVVHYVNYVYKNITPFPCDPCE